MLTGYRLQDTGYNLQASSYRRLQATGYKLQATGYKHHVWVPQDHFGILAGSQKAVNSNYNSFDNFNCLTPHVGGIVGGFSNLDFFGWAGWLGWLANELPD